MSWTTCGCPTHHQPSKHFLQHLALQNFRKNMVEYNKGLVCNMQCVRS